MVLTSSSVPCLQSSTVGRATDPDPLDMNMFFLLSLSQVSDQLELLHHKKGHLDTKFQITEEAVGAEPSVVVSNVVGMIMR